MTDEWQNIVNTFGTNEVNINNTYKFIINTFCSVVKQIKTLKKNW